MRFVRAAFVCDGGACSLVRHHPSQLSRSLSSEDEIEFDFSVRSVDLSRSGGEKTVTTLIPAGDGGKSVN